VATKRCCCSSFPCLLGTDTFDRADSSDPGPQWHIVSGTGAIVSGQLHVSGVVATTICHPPSHTNGSWVALFELRNMRIVTLYEVGAGDPLTSGYYVRFEPMNMDTAGAIIRVTVVGSTTETFDYVWPSGMGGSVDFIEAQVCYEPGGLLRGSIQPPAVDVCIPHGGAACYLDGSTEIGGFFFKEGHFDDWLYYESIIDNFDCQPCGCFCFRREGSLKEWSCYPEVLYLNLSVTTGFCSEFDGLSIAMTQGELAPGDGYPEKAKWFSGILTCGGFNYTFVLECSTIVKDGTNWLQALRLRITDSSYVNSTVLFQWAEPTDAGSTREADYTLSACDPLALVFPGLKVNSFFGPCGDGSFGHFIFCCGGVATCEPTPLDIQIQVTVTT
jgi:hypothetical protein